jgi:hypothetical protein
MSRAIHNSANPTGRRVGQLLRLVLSSNQPGEVAAAASALNRALAASGLDLHNLAEVAETGLQLPVPSKQPPDRRPRSPTTNTKARRPDGRPLQMEEQLVCDQADGVFRACGCGGILFTVMPGVGPHVAQLVCTACRRGGRWLSRAHFGATP